MSSGSGLPPHQHAVFAVTSRLISCLVTEQILKALYLPSSTFAQTSGFLVVFSADIIPEKAVFGRVLSSDIFALIPLRRAPVLHGEMIHGNAHLVGLVDPLDMYPEVLELRETSSTSGVVSPQF
jgi:hypothetical protein